MILNQANLIAQSVIANGLTTGNKVQNQNNLLNTTDDTALFGATSDVIIGNFPFNIPLNAIIVGIKGIIKARIDNSSIPAGSITPYLVDGNLRYGGNPVIGLSNVLQEYAIGGDTDVWGNTAWTPQKINNLQLQLVANSALEVAWASMTVFYYIPIVPPTPTPPGEGCPDCESEIQALPFKLKRVWRTNETKLLVESFNDAGDNPITLDMIGECGGSINLTIDPDKRRSDGGNFIENFNIDSSIATISMTQQGIEIDIGDIQQRGLGFTTGYGHDVSNISEHGVGAILIITNNGPWASKILKKCHIGVLVSAPITGMDEGVDVVYPMEKINVIGDNAQLEPDAINPRQGNLIINTNPTNVDPTEENTNTGTNGTTPTPTLTVPINVVNANYLRVKVITEDLAITSVEHNGTPMSLVGEQSNPGVNLKVAIFHLINPATGVQNVVITMPSPCIITAIVTGWLDVDVSNPVDGVSGGALGFDDMPTDSLTTTTDNSVVEDVVGTTNNPTTFAQSGLWAIMGDVTAGTIRPGASASRKVISPMNVVDAYGISLATGWAILLAGIRGISAPAVSDEKVKATATDTTPGYLNQKMGMGSSNGTVSITPSTQNPGGNEVRFFDVTVQKNNLTATTNPGAGDDNTQGYIPGSIWFNKSTSELYIADSVGTGAAVWDLVASGTPGVGLDVYVNGALIQSGVTSVDFTGSSVSGLPTGPDSAEIQIGSSGGSGTRVLVFNGLLTANTTSTLATFTIPANTLGTDNAVRLKLLVGSISLGVGASITISSRYGSGGSASITYSPFTGAITNQNLTYELELMADGATNAQKIYAESVWPSVNSAGAQVNSALASSSEDSTASQLITIAVTVSGTAFISFQGALVDKIQ